MATSPVIARGANKTIAIAAESGFAAQAPSPGQLMRRTQAVFNLLSQQLVSTALLDSRQIRNSFDGPRNVQGTLAGYLSPGTYHMLFEALLRGMWTPILEASGITDAVLTIDGTSGVITVSGPADQFLSKIGLRVGDVFRWNGLSAGAAVDNGVNLRIRGVTDNQITVVATPGIVAFSGQTESLAVIGRKLVAPQSGQIDRSFSIEEWHSDIGESYLWLGCRMQQITVDIPATGYVTFQASLHGASLTKSSSRVYTAPTAAPMNPLLTAVSGKVSYNGVDLAVITNLRLAIAADLVSAPSVGALYVQQIFADTLRVSGAFSALMASDGMTADFLASAEVQISILLTTSASNSADFIAITLPRVKLTAAARTDTALHLSRNFEFVALEQATAGQFDATAIVIQDSMIHTPVLGAFVLGSDYLM